MSEPPSEDAEGRWSLELSGQRQDAGRARAFLAERLPALGWSDFLDDASLLVSELIANVAIHARTACEVQIRVGRDLRIDVLDSSPVMPKVRRFGPDSTTGRGLRLVRGLADDWGVERAGTRKRVWFRFDAGSRERRAAAAAGVSQDPDATPDLDALLAEFGSWDEDDTGPVSLARSR